MTSLHATAQALVAAGKGLLAMDESIGTCTKRFASVGLAPSSETRRAYRELLVTTPGLGDYISGAILHEETLVQKTQNGTPLVQVLMAAGILPGIKVDQGTVDLAGLPAERATEGLDGLRERLKDYAAAGARFAKWRAVFTIGAGLPTAACIEANAHDLARYAALCQEAELVPIVEPEVLMEGSHTLARCQAVTDTVLHQVFDQLHTQGVVLEALVLKPNMVLPGLECSTPSSVDEVAEATVACLRRAVPAAVAGIAFLSGGQSSELASARLNAMHLRRSGSALPPWPLTFSFARALQQPALHLWASAPANRAAAQQALLHRARCNGAALRGAYDPGMENQ
ncbi:fructose-bisphosphate aldolase [Acidovorax sp. SRB_14]|uniref:class I fructose-bisphosphate aldolase n=1 Tax=unclassified Acidovorax TaxID=2684926 RepID=UPI00145EFB69|nr:MULTISPECIES: class I fructose-bisphosphate aldolase [unclassified Acidovorax]NMM77314.1 fructose-bisphosphate aldolase [Acidovorax sp. SRB_24]NMM80196.1 fructose-bisphosphate aldolase [Acidovorax sp. SRB_14]NMM89809.1 fructose-bisphosphate aldolase [Rhodococcus sp. SRB_17]